MMPEVERVLVQPGDPGHVVVSTRYGGLYSTRDGGSSWQHVCHEALGADDSESYPGVLTRNGTLVLSTGFRGVATTMDGCAWGEWFPPGPGLIRDVATFGEGGLLALNEGAPIGSVNAIWASEDGGQSFSLRGSLLPADVAVVSVRASPDGARWFVTTRGAARPELHVSGDGGVTWLRSVLPGDGSLEPRLVGITASPVERIVVVLAHPEVEGVTTPGDSLIVSEDGGTTWQTVFTAHGALRGATLTSDGALLFGGPVDGLLRSVLGQGVSGVVEPVSATPTLGLTASADRLFSIGHEPTDGYSVAISLDGGVSFAPFLRLCTAQLTRACSSESTVGLSCSQGIETDPWEPLGDVCVSDAGTGGPLADAGSGGGGGAGETAPKGARGAAMESASCGVALGGRNGRGVALLATLGLLVLLRLRRSAHAVMAASRAGLPATKVSRDSRTRRGAAVSATGAPHSSSTCR